MEHETLIKHFYWNIFGAHDKIKPGLGPNLKVFFSSTFVYMYLYMYQHIDKICFSSLGQKEILYLNCVY